MKKFLLSSVALLGLTAGAVAADLPVRTMAPMAPAPMVAAIPVFTWSGFYAGVNAGYGWNDNDNDHDGFFNGGNGNYQVPLFGGGVANYTLSNPNNGFFGNDGDDGGFVGGGQIGFNFQPVPGSGFVFGVEADIQGVFNDDDDDGFFGNNGTTFYNVAPTGAVVNPGFGVAGPRAGAPGNIALFDQGGAFGNNGIDWFGTLRLRGGFAFDRVLVYATGGLAFGGGGDNNNHHGFMSGNSVPAPFFVNQAAANAGVNVNNGGMSFGNGDDVRMGYALGGGVEWAVLDNMTFKIEGLYVNLDNDNGFNGNGNGIVGVTNTGAPVRRSDMGFGFGDNNNSDFFVVRGGLNFKFNTF